MPHIPPIAAAAALLAPFAPTQDGCPKTKAVTVPRAVEFHGAVKCGSVSLNIGGATVSGPSQGCPLLAVLVPEHECTENQASGARTYVQVYGQVTTRIYHFACERDWLLFLPWGSTCRLASDKAGAVLPRMTTVPCEPPERPGTNLTQLGPDRLGTDEVRTDPMGPPPRWPRRARRIPPAPTAGDATSTNAETPTQERHACAL